jgi:hypothetical protein
MKQGTHIISLLLMLLFAGCSKDEASFSGSPSSTALAGSLSRFAIAGNTLYCVKGNALDIYDISNNAQPNYLSSYGGTRNIETAFIRDSVTLFLGTPTGMQILNITNRAFPSTVSFYSHIRSCDPVVADKNYAYVTLRSGTPCGMGLNQLDIIDIDTLQKPKLLKSYALTHPYGLAILGNRLLVCDGGIRLFDVSDPFDMKFLSANSSSKIYDVIPLSQSLITVGDDGMKQFVIQNDSLVFLSVIK